MFKRFLKEIKLLLSFIKTYAQYKTSIKGLEHQKVVQKVRKNLNNSKAFKKRIRELKGNKCWCCGDKGSKGQLQLHHIIPLSTRPDLAKEVDNIILLCPEHHTQYHRDFLSGEKFIVKK